MRCYYCNKASDSMQSDDGVEFCQECYESAYQECDGCGYWSMTQSTHDDSNYCMRCYDEYQMMVGTGKRRGRK